MSRESYVRGFVKAAQANGVDPKALAKFAEETVGSTPFSDWALSIPGNMLMGAVPGLGNVVNTGAYIGGLASNVESEDGKREAVRALIPGVGSYRFGNRIRSQVLKELDDIKANKDYAGARPKAHAIAEHLGGLTSPLAAALLGGALGAGAGGLTGKGENAAFGAGVGAIGGAATAGLAQVIGAIAAGIKRRRTKEEQIKSDKGSLLAKYLLPGVSTYDYYKRIGRSQGDREEAKKEKKTDKAGK